ncbi:MAG: HD domain-containing protein [Candidatus Lambdaproteobacteria bacterium]|nr:HD domain-containing protein [Candidatus Lambdaproteobacteria bacterium]
MAADTTHLSRQQVKAADLRPGMVIHEIVDLSFEYATLDARTLQFLQSNFRGALALVSGEQGSHEVPVEQLKEFDQVQAIVNIPATLKLAQVVPGLGDALEKRGFLEFKVSLPSAGASGAAGAAPRAAGLAVGSAEARKLSAEKVVEVRKLIETVQVAREQRNKASNVVEEMFDRGRTGQFSASGVEATVTAIVKEKTGPALQAVAGLRGSDQTYAHCVDMSVIVQGCYADVLRRTGKAVDDAINRFTLVSGFMHDIGKSRVPKDILDSTVRFAPDSQEMLILRNHTTYGARILEEMGMHKTTVNVAHYHHVKRDETLFTSYPDVSYDAVHPLTRFAAIVDVYQALIGKRKYKRNWVPGKAIEYIRKLSGSEFDPRMVEHFIDSMGIYPVGSLVRLSTGELAFVLMIAPREHPDRPIVAAVETPGGELLTHHQPLDLMLHQDISVAEVVDHYEHYKLADDQAYKIFESIRLN